MNQFTDLSWKDKKMLLAALGVITLMMISFAIFPHWTKDRNLAKSHRYTFATVDSLTSYSEGDPYASFHFNVNGKIYRGSASACCAFNNGLCDPGSWILVEYYPLDPTYNDREGDYYYTTKEFVKIPPNGWDSIPISIIKAIEELQ